MHKLDNSLLLYSHHFKTLMNSFELSYFINSIEHELKEKLSVVILCSVKGTLSLKYNEETGVFYYLIQK